MKNLGFAVIFLSGIALMNGCKKSPDNANPATPPTATESAAAANTNTPAVNSASQTNILSTDKARESYAVGMYMAHGWMTHGVDLDPDIVLRGIKDQEAGGHMLLSEQEMSTSLRELQQNVRANAEKMQQQAMLKNQMEGQTNLEKGTQFLADNRTKPGVITLPDGLQYKVIKEGTGPTPTANDIVKVNYRGTLIDGTEFDSSAKQGHPIEFPVREVIPGWTEALQKMKVGSKWQVFIPSNLAYGPRGAGAAIGPNETLIFEVELLDTKQGPPPPAPPQPLTSDIIKVPSADEMKKGAQIETIKSSDLQKMQQSATNGTNQSTNQ